MTLDQIAKLRLLSQQLIRSKCISAVEVVSHFGAMQAQDYAMSKWAVGSRFSTTDKAVEKALDQGELIRTHILRPTWHLVAPQDLRWMLALTSPQIKKINNSMCRKYSLESSLLNRCNTIIEKCLSGNKHLTRTEIVQELGRESIKTDELRATLIVMNAELDGVICNGARRGKQFTYALIDERIHPSNPLTKENSLFNLSQRYFTSHGPATVYDFAWWSGLTLTDARKAMELIKPSFQHAEIDGQVYWFDASLSLENEVDETIFFLPAYDEFMVSYKDRTASLDPSIAKTTITGNGIFKPIIVIEGKVMGTWKRIFKKDKLLIETQYFYPPNKTQEEAVKAAAAGYGSFMQMEIGMK